MLSIAHTATGALIATKISNPLISLPLILASHYIEDSILHWDAGTGLSSGVKTPSDAFKHEIIDMALSIIFILLIFQLPHSQLNLNAWLGAFVSLIPDFLEAPRNFLKQEPTWLRPINRFHAKFHHSTSNVFVGLLPQLILLIIVVIIA